MNFNYEYYKKLIRFSTLDVIYDDAQLLTELIKILEFFEIKNKFFEMIIDNANNNNTLKKEFKKVINRQDFR